MHCKATVCRILFYNIGTINVGIKIKTAARPKWQMVTRPTDMHTITARGRPRCPRFCKLSPALSIDGTVSLPIVILKCWSGKGVERAALATVRTCDHGSARSIQRIEADRTA